MKTFLILLTFALGSSAFAQTAIPIDSFQEVSPGIYRGARPGEEGLEALKNLGVKTLLNIEDDSAAIAWERAAANTKGLKMISLPLSGLWIPSDDQVNKILETLGDPALRPIFVHCLHGQDRTGMIIGLYRIYFEDWTPKEAYREMLDMGFHQILFFLDGYFLNRTGLDPWFAE
jgi:protein tyrosine/serine phosphatase